MREPTDLFDGAWRGRSVLVTGHTGFKGSWLSMWLERLGARVSGMALAPEREHDLFNEAELAQRLERHGIVDIRNADDVDRVVRDAAPDIVFHLAAQPLVRASFASPVETFESNVMGTINVLEAIRRSPSVQAVVVVTSDKCYHNAEDGRAYREGDPLGGHDPYSASKGCAEIVTASWRDSFLSGQGVGVASGRAGNVIGGGDWAEDRLIPDCIRALQAGAAPPIRNPRSVRPWQHVLEPLAGYLQVGSALLERVSGAAGAWNFGPYANGTVPVADAATLAASAWGTDDASWELVTDEGRAPHEATLLHLDNTRAVHRLGWRPVLPFEDAITTTVRWYRDRHDQRRAEGAFDAHARSIVDIEMYEQRAATAGAAWAASSTLERA